MHRGQSLYLDLLRLVAAFEVFLFHLGGLPGTGVTRAGWNGYGHEAVTVFFVLSGFVIRHAAATSDRDLPGFAVSRLTRVYSVAAPCLLLTLVFDAVGRSLVPSLYDALSPDGSPLVRLAIGSAMLNEAWVSVQMFSNTPYWSISYEFWYYVVFGALFYLRGRTRLVAAGLAAAIAGPKIMLLFPIWAFGWIAYRETASVRWSRLVVWIAFLQPVLMLIAYDWFSIQHASGAWLESAMGHEAWRNGLSWSRYVVSDTLLGASVAVHLVAAKHLGPELLRLAGWAEKPIRWGAAQSFTLYLLHQPAILVSAALVTMFVPVAPKGLAIAVSALVIVLMVAAVTESQRRRLKPLIRGLVNAVTRVRLLVAHPA
jgi:peptidoglycan/LPS O-acetylase OafA/YrhL